MVCGEQHYRYDTFGNQISTSAPHHRQQRWFNGLNQLVRLNQDQHSTRYYYDGLGRRCSKMTESSTIDYLWEDNRLIGEHQNGSFRWYLYEPNSHRPLALIEQGEVYYYHLDHLGTSIRLTDTSGTIVWEAQYQAYGKVSTLKHNHIDNPLRFQGQYFDTESGLHYNHHRYYCPESGRYIQQDPLGLLGGINPYRYTTSPTNYIDPLGLCEKEEGVGLMDVVHTSLDAAGLAPGVGIIPDALNTLLYLVQFDWINASISAAAMVPIVGQGATLGKYAAKGVSKVEKAVLTIAQKAEKLKSVKLMKKYNPPCFKPGKALKKRFKNNPQKLEKEFYKQIKDQQDGINKMTVGKYLENKKN